jgi:hypothetical protein
MWKRSVIVGAALALLLAACGGGESSEGIASLEEAAAEGSTTTALAASTDPEQAMLDFTQCMRDHGVDMPDPQMGPGGGAFGFTITGEPGEGPDDAEMQLMQEANDACVYLLEGMVQEFEMPDMSEMQDDMLAFSQCMRDHGIDYPDPEFTDDGAIVLGAGPGEDGGIDFGAPGFQEAMEACQEIFGGAGGPFIISNSTDAPLPGGEGEGGMVIIGGGDAVPVPGGDE